MFSTLDRLIRPLLPGLLLVTMLGAIPGSYLSAQEELALPGFLYGLFGDYNLVRHDAAFSSLPGVPNCCSEFEEGSGSGLTIGGLLELPLGDGFGFGIRGAYTASSARLLGLEQSTVMVDGKGVPAVFEHRIDARIASIGLEPSLLYRVYGGTMLHLGTRIAMVTTGTFAQQEQILEPFDVGSYQNGSRIRNEYSGEIPEGSTMEASLVAGISRDFPMGMGGRMRIAPEIFYTHSLTSIATGLSWNASALRVGVALKVGPRAPADAPPPPPVIVTTDKGTIDRDPEPPPGSLPTPSPRMLTAALRAVVVTDDEVEHDDVTIRYEEFMSAHLRPLLNYLFFDEGGDRIPSRYTMLSKNEAENFFVEEDLHDVATLPTYYHLLNIVGRRMTQYPKATITLVGCNKDEDVEAGNVALSRRRAEQLFAYLRDVWKIDSTRMTISVRNLPAKPSNIDKEDGDVENRRVEIHSDTWEIIEPVLTHDTLRVGAPPVLRFYPSAMADAGIGRWRLSVTQGHRRLKEFEGEGELPRNLDWDIRSEIGRTISPNEPMHYSLELADQDGESVRTIPGEIPIEAMTIQEKRRRKINDRFMDRYALILFDFDRGDLNVANSTIGRFVRDRISAEATTTISGFTDRMGDDDHNLALSRARATSTASALGVPAERATGYGETNLLFDNELPEGRHYCRTVNVLVETPVEYGADGASGEVGVGE